LSCDVARGVCRNCVTDADCTPARPYCDPGTRACIECFTDANCGPEGEKCADGKCGSCGDGICGRHERIFQDFGPVGGDSTSCLTDCEKLCPGHDLKSKLGKGILSGTFAGEHQLFPAYCTAGDGPDVTATWTPPHGGLFYVGATGSSVVSISAWAGGCTEMGASQCSVTNPGETTTFSFDVGKAVTIVIRPATNITGTFSLDITDTDPSCDSGDCRPDDPGMKPPAHDGGVSSAAAALCLDNARARHEEICAGTECACSHCPQDYDDCGVVPGCKDVRACMTEKACIGADCYISGQCRNVIDTYSGLSGPAFRAAASLQSCALSLKCDLPCGGGASVEDAGTADAGPACTPRRPVSCPCEGGVSGAKVCKADGSGFGPCVCDDPPLTPMRRGDCECTLGRRRTPAGAAVAVLALSIALGSRRRSARQKRRREEE
jgi:hypothetical protein